MTNKPMLSVERELLERLTENWNGTDARIELRALLDKPVCAHEFESPVLSSMPDFCKKCSEDKPAAQHQGEPVPFAWFRFDDDQKAIFTRSKRTKDSEALYVHPTAYRVPRAEQPAPVAVLMPERKTKADYSGYIEQFQSEAAGLYNSALADVARLNGVKP